MAEPNVINVDDTPVVQPDTINVDEGQAQKPWSPDIASVRAYKALVGVGPMLNKTYDLLYKQILEGDEPGLRKESAAAMDQNKALNKQQALRDVAIRDGTPLSPVEINSILDPGREMNKPTNPDTVLESSFGKYFTDAIERAAVSMPDTVYDEAKGEVPNSVQRTKELSSDLVTKRELIQSRIDNAIQNVAPKEGYGSYIANFALNAIPGQVWQQHLMRQDGSLGLGNNLEEQGNALFRKPVPVFAKTFNATMDELEKTDPNAAILWAKAMLGQSSDEKFLANWMPLLDLPIAADLGFAGKALLRKGALANEVRLAQKDLLAKGDSPSATISTITAAIGDTGESAVQSATTNAVKKFTTNTQPIREATDALTTNLDLDINKIKNDPKGLAKNLTNILVDNFVTAKNNIIHSIAEATRVLRLPVENATQDQIRLLKQSVMDQHVGVNIADIADPILNPVSNTWYYDMKVVNNNGDLFRHPLTAETYAVKVLGLEGGYKVERQGLGFFIRMTENLDENNHVLRDLFANTKNAKSAALAEQGFGRYFNAIVGKFRSPEDTLAVQESERRKVATYAQARMQKYADAEAKSISDVMNGRVKFDPVTGEPIDSNVSRVAAFFSPKERIDSYKRWQQFNRILDYAREADDPVTKLKGYTFRTPGEINDFYLRNFQREASFGEIQSYFAKGRLDEFDRVLRNIAEFRNRARLGTAQHSFTWTGENGKVESPFFDGIVMDHMPGGGKLSVVGTESNMVIINNNGKHRVVSLGSAELKGKALKRMQDNVIAGRAQVVRIYDPEKRPLAGIGNIEAQRIRYVYTENLKTKPLSWEQVPRRGGGHFEYDYPHYIKQPNVRFERIGNRVNNWYEGDTTLMPISNKTMGNDIVKHLENARVLYKSKNYAGAKAYVQQHLPFEWDTFDKWFKPGRDPSGNKIPARLSVDHPFYVVSKGNTVLDVDKSFERRFMNKDGTATTLRDGTRGDSDARQFQVQYTGQRDAEGLFTLNNEGTRSNPIYKVSSPDMIDPIPTMTRGLNRIINSTYMDDYKMYAVRNWLEEAAKWLDIPESKIRAAPFHVFTELANDFKKDAPKDVVSILKSNREKIRQFIGIPSTFDTYLHDITQRLVDAAYARMGPEGSRSLVQKAITVVPIWMLGRVKDPVTFVRSLAYNAKLGLFAVPQFIVQNQTYASIWAIAPKHAPAGTMGALMHQWSRFSRNPNIIEKLDSLASKMGFRPGEYKEGMYELDRSGFAHVGGEYAGLDDTMSHRFIKNDINSFLSMGQVFFKEGEKNVRYGAWYTAFREFRQENPTKAITQVERQQILQRADLLYTNMSRASSSTIHKGVFSLTTQFLSYQLRLAELMLGNRISPMAKMRMVGTYGALYGIPSAFGLSGLPLGDTFKQEALDHGYVVGDSWWQSLAMEGIPAWTMAMVTGKGDIQKGNWYNVGDRYGVQGFTQIREALRSDKPWWGLIGGAGVATLANTWTNLDGFTYAMRSMILGKPGEMAFPFKLDDLTDIFKEASSFTQGQKMYVAAQTGKWIDKNEAWIGDVSKANAVFMGFTGLSPQEQGTRFSESEIKADELAVQKHFMKRFIEEFRRGAEAAGGEIKNPKQASEYFSRAFAYLEVSGYPRDKMGQAIAIAGKGYENMIDQSDYAFAFKNVPQYREQVRQDAFKAKQQIKDKRAGLE